MAGPAIRAWRVAERAGRSTTRCASSASPGPSSPIPAFSVEVVRHDDVDDLVDWCDVFVFQGWVMAGLESFQRSDKVFVADIYDPLHLEQLEQARDDGERIRRRAVRRRHRGAQRAAAARRLLPLRQHQAARPVARSPGRRSAGSTRRPTTPTPASTRSIDIVPFGISDHPPERTGPGIRGVIPGIGADDTVILWGGGVYNWFDPLTLIRAVDQLRARRPDVRLVFLGMRHPNPDIPEMRMAVAGPAAGRRARAHRRARLLQRGVGALRPPAELPARRRRRRHHPLPPRRDRLLVPHPGARLPVGRRCRR